MNNALPSRLARFCLGLLLLASGCGIEKNGNEITETITADALPNPQLILERVTTLVPFPRGLAVRHGNTAAAVDRENNHDPADATLYVLARGRVRGAGGVTASINDRAGTIFAVDPSLSRRFVAGEKQTVAEEVRKNGTIFAEPCPEIFHLWDPAANPPERDRWTDRPYCTLRWHEGTQSFYLCAFSGIDKPKRAGAVSFSKNLTDAVLRFDLRTRKWSEIERHRQDAGGNYPHHDPAVAPPPHGWLNGPNNCLPVGNALYVAAKDNSVLVRYDLRALVQDPAAGPPPSRVVLTRNIFVRGLGMQTYLGQSALAYDGDGWLYLAYRTSGVVIRVRIAEAPDTTAKGLVQPVIAELVAVFDPYDAATGHSSNLTDMAFDEAGEYLYLISAQPARIYRLRPGTASTVFDGRSANQAGTKAWADLAKMTQNPKMKSENLLVHDGYLYVTSGDGYRYQNGAAGTVWRIRLVN